jgi:hypothetical protein
LEEGEKFDLPAGGSAGVFSASVAASSVEGVNPPTGNWARETRARSSSVSSQSGST